MEEKKEDDDAIEIDLSRLTNFFKRKKKAGAEPEKAADTGPKSGSNAKESIETKEDKNAEKGISRLKEEAQEKGKLGGLKIVDEPSEKELEKERERIKEAQEENDDEINIDFGKIKGFFSKAKGKGGAGKEEKPKSAEHKAEDDNDDEIRIDFSKIKGFFSGAKGKEDPKKEGKSETNDKAEGDDDEINIDFSRIKGIFSSKSEGRESEKAQKAESPKEDDDEVGIDFSKLKNIKNIFKKSDDEKRESHEDEVQVDFRKGWEFILRHKVLLLILIPLFFSVFLRMQPAYLPITDDWAASSVISSIQGQISSQVNQQYPNLPQQNRDILVNNQMQGFIEQNKAQIDEQVRATSDYFKSKMKDDSGQTYLLEIDPYFWLRYTENIMESGHPGDELRNGIEWDNRMYAPGGRPVPYDRFHAYLSSYLIPAVRALNPDASPMAIFFYMPVLLSALAVIPAFFIARKIGGNFGGFIAAFVVAIHPSFLTRTAAGFSDTDAYNVLFPLLIAWVFIEALDSKSLRKTAALAAINSILIALYCFAWGGGWWYIFDFVLASAAMYIGYFAVVHRKELFSSLREFLDSWAIKNSMLFIALFFILSGIIISATLGLGRFQQFYSSPMGFARLKEVGITTGGIATVWPNVFTTVAEQNPASLGSVISQIGFGTAPFLLLALAGVTLTLSDGKGRKKWFVPASIAWYAAVFALNVQNLNLFLLLASIPIAARIMLAMIEADKGIDIKYSIFLAIWFLVTIYASTKGVRFLLLLVPAFGIGFGAAFGRIYEFSHKYISGSIHINQSLSRFIVVALLLALLIGPYRAAANTARNEIPLFNDNWRISLEKIRDNSKEDAIVNSWWDYGHWFKYWADRAVTFDGTSQNTAQAHWIGKVLLTEDEDMAVGILRTLDCSGGVFRGGSKAFGMIDNHTRDQPEAVDVLNEAMVLDREGARKVYERYLEDEEVEQMLEYTHCSPPENFFITSEDMVAKSGVWAHFGSWDFNRALIYNYLKSDAYRNDIEKSAQFLQERFGYSKDEAEKIFFEVQSITDSTGANNWIAPWPGYAGTAGCSQKGNDSIVCGNVEFNLTAMDSFADSGQGILHPAKAGFHIGGNYTLKSFEEAPIVLTNGRNLGMALVDNGEGFTAVQMDADLTGSMFTRMFYQEGIGLKHFEKFSDERTIFGGRIIVWKVDWDGIEEGNSTAA
ncbi:hypothetical protein J4212_08565 [Candidatus Woesearchaeota archaeon]|nr:hypothetical protein [Candidatus Woesearchaeota archaeon]